MTLHTQDPIDFMSEVYTDYVVKHSLPMVSADEQDSISPEHDAWLSNFITIWDYAQSIS
tara:strand:- start:305 stop:481 length:177 start_codon:yes stop_codon:yes gene_type:complete